MAAYPISWTITAIVLVVAYFMMMRKITPETV